MGIDEANSLLIPGPALGEHSPDIATVADVDEWYSDLRDLPPQFVVTTVGEVYLAWVEDLDGPLTLRRLTAPALDENRVRRFRRFDAAFDALHGAHIINPVPGPWEEHDPRLAHVVRRVPIDRELVDEFWGHHADDVWAAIQRASGRALSEPHVPF